MAEAVRRLDTPGIQLEDLAPAAADASTTCS